MALSCPCRDADLAALNLKNRSYVPEEVVFQAIHLSKQSQSSHPQVDFFFLRFQSDPCLCPVECLRVYKQMTASFHDNPRRIFYSDSLLVNMALLHLAQ